MAAGGGPAASVVPPHIAVVGGGVAGCAAARALSLLGAARVTVLDYGSRGVGGRASHRERRGATDGPPDSRHDHGCQHVCVRADASRVWRDTVAEWVAAGALESWTPRVAAVSAGADASFFGASATLAARDGGALEALSVEERPPTAERLYTARGGQRNLCEALLRGLDGVCVRRGVRVRAIERAQSAQRWVLRGNPGNDAHHEASEARVGTVDEVELLTADGVVFTDSMCAFPDWHRAAVLGLHAEAPALAAAMSARRMAPLFACMLSFESAPVLPLRFDACVMGAPGGEDVKESVLQWACNNGSKPGGEGTHEQCWTLVSTRTFAESCLRDEPMSAPTAEGGASGEHQAASRVYRPQEQWYLKSAPAEAMVIAFKRACEGAGLVPAGFEWPRVAHSVCQRWGAAYVDIDASEYVERGLWRGEAAGDGSGAGTHTAPYLLDEELGECTPPAATAPHGAAPAC